MEHSQVMEIAQEIKELLIPYCSKVEIAGSLRREKPEVKDIEIVAMPNVDESYNLFGESTGIICPINTEFMPMMIARRAIKIKGGFRYIQLLLPQKINLDLFIVRPPAQWGVIYTIRTGPAAFSQWLVTSRAKHGGMSPLYRIKDGGLYRKYNDELIPTPEETDLFKALDLQFIEPSKREAMWNNK